MSNKENKIGTPINDFTSDYSTSGVVRLHMPGHKGYGDFGQIIFSNNDDNLGRGMISYNDDNLGQGMISNSLDITEISGADSLYEADGIILESENNASELFGTRHTFYSCGGSSQSIKSMCYLALKHAASTPNNIGIKHTPTILAGRNAHRAFLDACMLLKFDVEWLYSEDETSLCRILITAEGLDKCIQEFKEQHYGALPSAIYVTSPDYLGNVLDIRGLAETAHKYGILLLCDNAHGSYLRFISTTDTSTCENTATSACENTTTSTCGNSANINDLHPITLGADIVCDSAHKTLPVLTGGAYLHVSKNAPEGIEKEARQAMVMFGSTSPSYLILNSLDKANKILSEDGYKMYQSCHKKISELKEKLTKDGIILTGDEPLKITIDAQRSFGLSGTTLADILRKGLSSSDIAEKANSSSIAEKGNSSSITDEVRIECEYADRDYLVTMWSPCNPDSDYEDFYKAIIRIMGHRNNISHEASEIIHGKDKNKTEDAVRTFRYNAANKYQPYETLFMDTETVKVSKSICGRIAADTSVHCPPAILPIVPGEMIDENTVAILKYNNINQITVIRL